MEVTEALVKEVARLARLALTDAEVAATVPTLARILRHVEAVAAVDVSGVDPAGAPAVPLSALREDAPAPGLSRREALSNAPAHDQVFFLVPKVLEDGG
jgi:aspartyl-tRNA(Asn)/glutamyl-tRNA(Gln) amidotransferase subunit C